MTKPNDKPILKDAYPYWCDTCLAHFHGREAIPHKGRRCHAKDEPQSQSA